MVWRKWNYILHRDVGFACIGLTLLYAISGVAVNHRRDWNPNYRIEKVMRQVAPQASGLVTATTVQAILYQLGESRVEESYFQPDPENLWIFIDGRVARVHLKSGVVEYERVARRTFWYPLNALHLNHPQGAWTWIADLYAVALAFVAISGLLMLRRSTLRRGLLLTGFGLVVPLLFVLFVLE
jgi:hypothetical protein